MNRPNARPSSSPFGRGLILLVAGIAALVTSCAAATDAKSQSVTGVTISQTVAALTVGDTLTLTAGAQPAGASQTITWTSDKQSVAKVTSAGVVSAEGTGSAVITATADGGKTATCIVAVAPALTGSTSVTVRISLPRDATGKSYFVGISDTMGSVPSVAGKTGTVTGSSITHTFTKVPAGTYYIYAAVDVAGTWSKGTVETVKGDFIAVYMTGAGSAMPTSPNAVVPASGTTTFDLNSSVFGGSSNASLATLTLSQGTLSPAFASATHQYTAIVANAVSSLVVGASADNTGASVTGTGAKSLAVGLNTLSVIVTAEDGTTTETYTIVVLRQPVIAPPPSPASVSGTVTLPASVSNKPYAVYIDADINYTNGAVLTLTGYVTGETFTYSFPVVPPGTYTVYFAVNQGDAGGPVTGDYVGMYGATTMADALTVVPNLTVPATGSVTANMTGFVYSAPN